MNNFKANYNEILKVLTTTTRKVAKTQGHIIDGL